MPDEMTDSQLLSEFVRTRSNDAFAGIVRRYVGLVHGTARRIVADEHLAQDVVQATFIVLLKKAPHVNPRTLPGWLVNTARLAAKEAIRSARTRAKHETLAAPMRSNMESSTIEPTVEQIAPLLDEALSHLGEDDRAAIVRRFLDGASFAQIGAAMELTEEAARKRVARALEKLRGIFMRQGIVPSIGGLIVILAAEQAKAAPAALVSLVSGSLLAGGTAQSVHLANAVATAMKWAKIKIFAAIVSALIILGGGVWIAGKSFANPHIAAPQAVVNTPAAPVLPPPVAVYSGTKITNSIGMTLVEIKPGTFLMGSPTTEEGRDNRETQHEVKLTKGFFIASTPVTQMQWTAVMGNNPSKFHGDSLPVEQVNYPDALAFCAKLSSKEGKQYRLPTEAEWEYSCRAGTTTSFYTGDDEQACSQDAWHFDNAERKTHPVGQKKANAWGLYDMLGNVNQWCSDWYGDYPAGDAIDPHGPTNGQSRVLRGGSWNDYPRGCRSAARSSDPPTTFFNYLNGVRVVRELDQ